MSKKQQQIAAYVFGIVFVVAMLMISIFVPNPTHFQYVVFRVVLALATAGVAAIGGGTADALPGETGGTASTAACLARPTGTTSA